MTTNSPPKTREAKTRDDRLAEKLRENLRRRKTQARAKQDNDAAPLSKEPPKS